MDGETLTAVFSVIEAFIGLIAIIIEKSASSKSREVTSSVSKGNYSRLFISCILVYAVTGIGTAIIAGFATFAENSAGLWATAHTCWVIGYSTIIIMVLFRLYQDRSNEL